MKNILDGIKSRLDIAEEKISELQDKAINIIQNETKIKKKNSLGEKRNSVPVSCRTTSVA